MPKLSCLSLLFLLLSLTVQAQEPVHVDAVPGEIRLDFGLRFEEPEKAAWFQQPGQYWGARFRLRGKSAEVVYDAQGKWLQTEEEVAYKMLPDSARAHCRNLYPDFHAKTSRKVATRKYGIVYEAVVQKGLREVELAFDMNGKLIEETEIEREEVPESKGLRGKISKLMKK